MSERPLLLVLMPSLRISGGNKETVRLVREILDRGEIDVLIASMWKHPHEVDTSGIPVVRLLQAEPVASRALVQFPRIAMAFRKLLPRVRQRGSGRLFLMLTHYTTYPLAWLAPSQRRICFNQDMEWRFVPAGLRRFLLRGAILLTNRRSTVVTTNAYVTDTYLARGIQIFGEASIWADPKWLTPETQQVRDIDVLMLLRGSGIKRLDLYLQAIELFRAKTRLRLAVITPDSAIAEQVQANVRDTYLRPTDGEMQALFARSKCLLLLSDVEGFGLPPLEAMGSGCVPACRDSGGVRCYMQGDFAELLFAPAVPIQEIVDAVARRIDQGTLPEAAAARHAFSAGLEASRRSREVCVQALWALLREGQDAEQ